MSAYYKTPAKLSSLNPQNVNDVSYTNTNTQMNIFAEEPVTDPLSKVAIYNVLTEYEDVLSKLVDSVDSYKPDVQIAKNLIEVDKKLYKNLDEFTEYEQISTTINEINDEATKVDLKTKEILETLNECRDMLNTLPMLQEIVFEKDIIMKQKSKINSKTLLDYATKLSKFTKIPPTFDKGSIGPNNFVWPAEDALRRGMLAIASFHSKKLTKLANQKESSEESESGKNTTEDTNKNQTELETRDEESGIIYDGSHRDQDKGEESTNQDDNMDLDLDLFNPDEF